MTHIPHIPDSTDTDACIGWCRDALVRVVGGMLACLRILGDVPLPGAVRLRVLRDLLSAESATRRMIFCLARGLTLAARRKRTGPFPKIAARGAASRAPSFPLFDPRKFFSELAQKQTRRAPGAGPRIGFFDDDDQRPAEPEASDAAPSAERLLRRMQAVQLALADLPKQARRLARARARRAQAPPGPKRVGPLRPGAPPGYRKRGVDAVNDILAECDRLARVEPKPPDILGVAR